MYVKGKKIESDYTADRIPRIQEIRQILLDWEKKNYVDFPWRSTSNEFHALIAEVMLQRTRAEQVLPVYLRFTEKYQTPNDVFMEKSEYLYSLLGKLGLKWRAKKIIELSSALSKQQIPVTLEDLVKLPGVGLYAASAFLCFHRNTRIGIIDTNAIRLWTRLFNIKNNDTLRRKKGFIEFVEELTPENNFCLFNFAILDFTRIICRKKPVCNTCPLNSLCDYYMSIN